MKFLKYVSYSIESLCSEVQLPHPPSLNSVAVAALIAISHVACRALDDSF